MNYALEVLLKERENAREMYAVVQQRLVDLNVAIAAIEGSPSDKVAETVAENPFEDVSFEPEQPVEQVHIDVAAAAPVTTAVEHTLEEPKKRTKKAKKGKASADLSSPLPDAVAPTPQEQETDDLSVTPFGVGQSVVDTKTGEIGAVVAVVHQNGGFPVYELDLDGQQAFRAGHHLEALPHDRGGEMPQGVTEVRNDTDEPEELLTAQQNAGPKPWEAAPDPEKPAKPRRRSNGDIARDLGVSLLDVEAWKGGGRITKADIEAFAEQQRTLEEASAEEAEMVDAADAREIADANQAPLAATDPNQDNDYYDTSVVEVDDEVDPEAVEHTPSPGEYKAPW